jgi:1,2-phenylacetyl-CoA epoxidase PaaB subunit
MKTFPLYKIFSKKQKQVETKHMAGLHLPKMMLTQWIKTVSKNGYNTLFGNYFVK